MTPDNVAALPFVSVIVPVRNEEGFIAPTLDSILAQDYPADRIEILVADGMSDDRTRRIVSAYAGRCSQVRLIDNPGRVTPSGLNIAIAAARGEVICRIDGHCQVAPDFVAQNVQLLQEHPEAWIVGGPIVHGSTGPFGQAAAIAMSHPLGVGMATHRFPRFEGYVETVQFPAFRRWVFDRIGSFDTTLIRTEDDELNYRVMEAGGKMFISPRVRYVYYVRERIGNLFRQYLQYSFWRIPVMRKHRRPTTLRQVIPLLFFLAVGALGMGGAWLRDPLIALALPAVYAVTMLCLGVSQVGRVGWLVASLVPVAVVTMHVAYALGMGYGMLAVLFRARAWDLEGSMATLSR